MNQHFVPRLYLKQFSSKKGKEYFVDVYDKIEKCFFNTNIKKICAENDLYTLDSSFHNDIFTVEKIYSELIEPMYQKSYDILTNDEIFKISDQERLEILVGVIQLFQRNPRNLNNLIKFHLAEIEKLFTLATKENKKGLTYLSEDFSFREWSEEAIKQHFIKIITKDFKEEHLKRTMEIANYHFFAKIEVIKILDNSTFITSDFPFLSEDIIAKTENPFLKSKQFTIPLNPSYALKIYHDNTKELNIIYRLEIPHGNGTTASINSTVDQKSIRFLIGSKNSFEEYFKMSKFLMDTSIELKINAFRQIIEKIPMTEDSIDGFNLLKYYIEKYEQQGTLDENEQNEMCQKIHELAVKSVKGRIK